MEDMFAQFWVVVSNANLSVDIDRNLKRPLVATSPASHLLSTGKDGLVSIDERLLLINGSIIFQELIPLSVSTSLWLVHNVKVHKIFEPNVLKCTLIKELKALQELHRLLHAASILLLQIHNHRQHLCSRLGLIDLLITLLHQHGQTSTQLPRMSIVLRFAILIILLDKFSNFAIALIRAIPGATDRLDLLSVVVQVIDRLKCAHLGSVDVVNPDAELTWSYLALIVIHYFGLKLKKR